MLYAQGWKRRFFVLFGPSHEFGEGRLLYFEDDKNVNLQDPKGGIYLSTVQEIGPGDGPQRSSFKGGMAASPSFLTISWPSITTIPPSHAPCDVPYFSAHARSGAGCCFLGVFLGACVCV